MNFFNEGLKSTETFINNEIQIPVSMTKYPKSVVKCPACGKLKVTTGKFFFKCCGITHSIPINIRAKSFSKGFIKEKVPKTEQEVKNGRKYQQSIDDTVVYIKD